MCGKLNNFVDGAAFRQMVIEAAYAIETHKQELNDLNVFPVPDGDTGINMSMTIGAADTLLRDHEYETVGEAASAVAGAMLRGARGNSGVILSLLFRGFSKKVKGEAQADPMLFAQALREGVNAAYKAVARPAEGTILTVSRRAADAAIDAAETTGNLQAVLESASLIAREALGETTEQNPVLKKANVVDAGGAGFTLALEAMLAFVKGESPVHEAAEEAKEGQTPFDAFETEEINFTYCTEFIIERTGAGSPAVLREYLESIGDCVVVVDDEEIVKVHVHSNDPGLAIQKALELGTLDKIKIENMKIQHTQKLIEGTAAQPKKQPAKPEEPQPQEDDPDGYGIVAIAAGDGLHAMFRELGATRLVDGGQTMNPSTEAILKAVESVPADLVYVLPNNKNIIMAAQQVQPLTNKQVVVVPTKTVAQGISAMLAFDSQQAPEVNAREMENACSRVHTGEITYAARDSVFADLNIKAGDFLALLDGKLLDAQHEQKDAVSALVTAIAGLEDISYLTVIYGADADEAQANAVGDLFGTVLDDAEISVVRGGQPVYAYIVSAE